MLRFAVMRHLFVLAGILLGLTKVSGQAGNIGFGTLNPDSSAMLDITSNNKGILIPRMTSAEREAIVHPATGLMVFDSTEVAFWYYNGSNWQQLVPPPPSPESDVLFSQLDQTGIAGQAETPLASWTMPANTLKNSGESIELHAFGENISDTTQIKFKIGSHNLLFNIHQAGKWDARISLYFKNAGAMKICGTLNIAGRSYTEVQSAPIDFAQTIQIQLSGAQNQNLVNGVGLEGLVIYRKN